MTKQYLFIPKTIKNVRADMVGSSFLARPMHHYRKTGAHVVSSDVSCDTCKVDYQIGPENKNLGKKNDGDAKEKCCAKGPTGSQQLGTISSFSGRPTIRSSLNNVNEYYANYNSYLKNRGNTFDAKSKLRVDPNATTEFCETNPNVTACNTCHKTTFKPNNSVFKIQGSASSSSYVNRIKYNTIVKNNHSFFKTYGTSLQYKEIPIFITKHKCL